MLHFQEMYNVHVTLTTRENSEYPDFASIEFSGWPSDVDRACERFQQLMAYAVPNESVAWPELVETMLVPLSAKPAILGEKAVTLRGIMVTFSLQSPTVQCGLSERVQRILNV